MNDTQIREHIESSLPKNTDCWNTESRRKLTPHDRKQLDDITVQLDQFWDLLRQRRARRDAGQDPDVAQMRKEDVVEHYQQ